jgi:hypothetical protein
MTVILIIAALVLAGLVFCASVYVSARRQGPLAFKVLTRVMRSRLGQSLLRKSGTGLGENGMPSVESMQEVLQSNPELIEKLAAQQGMSGADVQAAMNQFQGLSLDQRRRALNQAQNTTGVHPGDILAAATAPSSPSAAQAKRKEAERRKRKQAKKQRRR